VIGVRVEHRAQNLCALAVLSCNVHACFVVVILCLQWSAEIADEVNDESVQGVIRSLLPKRVGPTFSAGQTMQRRTVARFRKQTDISAGAVQDIQHFDGRLFEGSAVMNWGPRFGVWRIHERRDALRGRTSRDGSTEEGVQLGDVRRDDSPDQRVRTFQDFNRIEEVG
jgi:hypothetical protein